MYSYDRKFVPRFQIIKSLQSDDIMHDTVRELFRMLVNFQAINSVQFFCKTKMLAA